MFSFLIDLCTACSVIGIWPRFIEPYLIKTTHLIWNLEPHQAHLNNLKIVHLSDLHFHAHCSNFFLKKIIKKVRQLKPDLLVFTGDFLCYSTLDAPERLLTFLNELKAPLGCFATFGNHDYAEYVSLNPAGVYDLSSPISPLKGIVRGIKTLCTSSSSGIEVSDKARSVPYHTHLYELLQATPFRVLDNQTVTLPIGLNITGLGDLALGRCLPQIAFGGYDASYPGLVLSHNPDTLPMLCNFPGDWILCGHTHGEQIHLPWPKWGRRITQKLARLENSQYTRGLHRILKKNFYVSRGLGCHKKPLRLFSPPEISVIHVKYPNNPTRR